MSKIAKWNIEKAKVKVVFRLQFHATHIPQSGWEKLFISFIPAGSGKATAKTSKANVRNGTCKWADPIYESTRLLQDSKTKRYDEKLYKLVVSMASSRSSILGEANINLADYADALKPQVASLFLDGNSAGAILHVNVQLLTSKTGFREFEQQREHRERRLLNSDGNVHDNSAGWKVLSSEETSNDRMDKTNAKVRFKTESKDRTSQEEGGRFNEDSTDSAIGFDVSSNTSESLNAEKNETSSPLENDSTKSTVSGELGEHHHNQSPRPEERDPSEDQFHVWGSDYSMDNNATIEETNRIRGCLEVAESSIIELKMLVTSLQNHANEMGVEMQNFTEQIAEGIVSGKKLAKEVSFLKSECFKFKDDLEGLRNSKSSLQLSSGEASLTNSDHLFQELQTRWLKGICSLEGGLKSLQNQACFGFHERDFGFLHGEYEGLLDILQDLKQATGENICDLPMIPLESEKVNTTGIGLLESIPDPKGDAISLERKILVLTRDLDQSKADQNNLSKKMDQMECYYEALIHELEENQKQMLRELQSLRNEHSTCHYTISSTKAQMEAVHRDMSEQISRFIEDREELESLNEELERRAVTSEAALKRAHLNYSVAVDQLQKDLELLSFQISSMFETNEKLIRQTHVQVAHSYNPDSNHSDAGKCQNRNAGETKQSLGSDAFVEDRKKSLNLQEELYQKVEEELCEMIEVNMQLDVFSMILRETFLQTAADSRLMKETVFELTLRLEYSNKSEELLMQRLHNAMDDLSSLNECNSNCTARYHDVTLQNQNLEEKLESATREKRLLEQKTRELEAVFEEYIKYESRFKACAAEKLELENLLNQESLENGHLRNKISLLECRMEAFEAEFKDLTSAKENMHEILNVLQIKLINILESYENKSNGQSSWSECLSHNLELKDFIGVVSQLEEVQHNSSGMILRLIEEKNKLEVERDAAVASGKSEVLMIKQKFEHDVRGMINKFGEPNAHLHDLQFKVEAFADKLSVRISAEEEFIQTNIQLFTDLASMDAELEHITFENKELSREISSLETVTEELERCKLTIEEFTQQNHDLEASLQDKTEETVNLALELRSLEESLKGIQDEFYLDREIRNKLEGSVAYLSHELAEKNELLLQFEQQKADAVNFRQPVSDLEINKSIVGSIQMESLLSEMHELLVAADVEGIFIRIQHQAWFEELVQKFQSSEKHLKMLRREYSVAQNKLSQCHAREMQCTEENAKLLKILDSMKSDLDRCVDQNRFLSDLNCRAMTKAESENRAEALEFTVLELKNRHVIEIEQLEQMLSCFGGEIDNLVVSLVEQETKGMVIEAKFDELTFLEENNEKIVMLQNQCNELTRKLSEQILKAEEFKNLSIHLRELKDKADASAQAREKRESEVPSFAMQESLRIAFIREQYETKLQELKHQLSISKMHGEEMLWKLQDAVDEIENRKKSEASYLKKDEELSLKILELEADLHSVLSDKCEKIRAYDQLKAEMECLVVTLEYSKDEKRILDASLQECNEEKSKITDELKYIKALMEGFVSPMNDQSEENPIKTILNRRTSTRDMQSENVSTGNPCDEVDECSTINSGEEHPIGLPLPNYQQGVNGNPRLAPIDQENLLQRDAKQLALINDHFKSKILKSSMENLQKELERMKIENSLSSENSHVGPNFEGLQRELIQLHKVNEELGNICPLFREFPVNGNALERVLALEIEFAKALHSKSKSDIQFQCCSNQQSDEEAMFQCFRDMNVVMRDMLEVKEKSLGVEKELREMHERYSQLSLDFAEVEGERQRLMMTLKTVRGSKLPLHLSFAAADSP